MPTTLNPKVNSTVVGIQGPAGSGAPGTTQFSGSGAPSSGTGINGDYYFNTANGDYYEKQSGAWVLLSNITGPAGAEGTPGTVLRNGSEAPTNDTGIDGDYFLDSFNGYLYQRVSGAYTEVGSLIGPAGPTGAQGTAGAAGAAGTVFRSGSVAPSNATGVEGDFYLNNATGALYQRVSGTYNQVGNLTGPQGAAGAPGMISSIGTYAQILGAVRSLTTDDIRAIGTINTGGYFDPTTGDCSTALQAVLDAANALRNAVKATRTYDDVHHMSMVTVYMPPGNYYISKMIVVPEWVELDCRGTLIRNYSGDFTNVYLPTIVFTNHATYRRIELQLSADGVAAHAGSGIVTGQSWTLASIAIAAGGSGHAVGDVVTIGATMKSPFYGATYTVTAVDGNGAITAGTLSNIGAYNIRPALQPATLAQSATTGAGSGFVATPAWSGSFLSGFYDNILAYNAGPLLTCNSNFGECYILGGGMQTSVTYGHQFGIRWNTTQAYYNVTTTTGGYASIANTGGDNHAGLINPVLGYHNLYCRGGTLVCSTVILDSALGSYLYTNHCSGQYLKGIAFWSDANDGKGSPCQSGYSFIINKDVTQICAGNTYDFGCQNIGSAAGNPCVYVDALANSKLSFTTSNKMASNGTTPATATKKITSLYAIGANNDSSVQLLGSVDGLPGLPVTQLSGSFGGIVSIWDGTNKYTYSNVAGGGGGGASNIPPVPGRFYGPESWVFSTSGGLGASGDTNDGIAFMPYFLGAAASPQSMMLEITAASTAAFQCAMAIYANSGGKPGAKLLGTGIETIAANATGQQIFNLSNQSTTLQPGLYWIGVMTSYASPAATFRAISSNNPYAQTGLGITGTQGAAGPTTPYTGLVWGGNTFSNGLPANCNQASTNPVTYNLPMAWIGF